MHGCDASAEKKANEHSLKRYLSNIKVHIRPKLGQLEVRHLTVALVDDYLITLAEGNLDDESIPKDERVSAVPSEAKRSRTILNGMVRMAHAHGAIPNNFMSSTFIVPVPKRPIVILTLRQIDQMLAACDTYRTGPERRGPSPDGLIGAVLRIMLGAGVRIGEALALRKCDVIAPTEEGAPWLVSIQGTVVQPDRGKVFRQGASQDGVIPSHHSSGWLRRRPPSGPPGAGSRRRPGGTSFLHSQWDVRFSRQPEADVACDSFAG
jgi:hypothetical protein